MKILLTGATGLIGSRFEELLFEKHQIIPLSSSNGVDITDKDSITQFLADKSFDVVVHMAGKTNVDSCELDKPSDLQTLGVAESELMDLEMSTVDASIWKHSKSAVAINSIGTKNLYDVARSKGAKFIYISTDFVFSGNDGPYEEGSKPDPVDWYGMSKYLGEKVLDKTEDLVVRISFPYGYESPVKKDLVCRLYSLLSEKSEVSLVSDQIITPTFIDDVVMGLDFLINSQTTGVIHLTGGSSLSPEEIGLKIKEAFGLTTSIGKSSLKDVYAQKAPRPFQSVMKNDTLTSLGFKPKTFDEGLELIKKI